MTLREVGEAILAASPADQTEVVLIDQQEHLTRFANSFIHQNVSESNVQITVRAVSGRRVGITVTNDTRRKNLERVAGRAYELAKLQPENHEFTGLPSPQPILAVESFDAATASCSASGRSERVGIICRKAAAAGCTAAGSLTTATLTLIVLNSAGVCAEHRTTLADASTVVMRGDASGWAQASGWSLDTVNTEELADEAIAKVEIGSGAREPEPGEYSVILDPYATSDLLEMLAFDGMSALAVQEGRSWMNGRIGQKVMAANVTIVDNGLDRAGWPLPFDFEGVPKASVAIVEEGVLKSPVYDSFTAGREPGRRSTGHSTPAAPGGRWGPLALNLFLRPGSDSVCSMIRSTERGLYISRFWYTRPVHPRDVVVTGMTRDGTFMIRHGEIAYPVKSMRFTQSYVDALNEVEAIGNEPRLLRTNLGTVSAPAVKIGRFRFTSATR